jgi:hypothetical protein
VNVHTAANPNGEVRAQFGVVSYPWYLERGTTRLLSYQQNYSLDESYALIDGFQLKVGNLTFAAPTTFLNTAQTVKVNSTTPRIRFRGDGTNFGGVTGTAGEFFGGGGEAATQADLVQDLEFRFTGVRASGGSNPNDTLIVSGGSIATVYNSARTIAARVRVPFELWEVERNRQINIAIRSRNADGGAPWGSSGTPRWYRAIGRDYIAAIATPYNENATINDVTLTSPNSTWMVYFDERPASLSHWDTGDKFVVRFANNVVPGLDKYSFTTPAPVAYDATKAKQDVSQINVFPNPYYGVNTEELNKYNRFVTFSHLPDNAIIRIYNLAGVQVREIRKDGATNPGQFMRWDLANESGLPVGSGLYIAHIEMPDIGAKKILKLAIVQEQQILDRF